MGKRYTDADGNEQPTEYGGKADNSTDPNGRVIPKTAGQLAQDMRTEGIVDRAHWQYEDAPAPIYGRRARSPRSSHLGVQSSV